MMSERDKVGKRLYDSRRRAFRRDAHSVNELGMISRLGSGTSPVASIQLELASCMKSRGSVLIRLVAPG
jgi:hypothetical protein